MYIKHIYKKLLCFLLVATMTGCASQSQTITITKNHYLTLPDFYLEDCSFPPPPELDRYMKMNFIDKEKVLVDTYLKAAELNQACNIRLTDARAYQKRLNEIYRPEANNDRTENPEVNTR